LHYDTAQIFCKEHDMQDERRRVSRHFFSAQAEVLEPDSNSRVTTRVSELSLYGCYLDMMNPFPPDTVVTLRVTANDETFVSKSRIVYSTPNVGSGATFLEVPSAAQALLERWLEQAAL
jgi:hypothetical protein